MRHPSRTAAVHTGAADRQEERATGKEEPASVAAADEPRAQLGRSLLSKQHKRTPWGVAGLEAPGEDTELACECTGQAGSLGTEQEPEALHKEGEKVKAERTQSLEEILSGF